MAAVIPDIRTRVLNTRLPADPAYARTMATEASKVELTMPNHGTPRLDRLRKRCGKRPPSAAAKGISAQIMVQPLRAPKPDTTTSAAMTLPAQVPPKMSLTAVENGAVESPSRALPTIP